MILLSGLIGQRKLHRVLSGLAVVLCWLLAPSSVKAEQFSFDVDKVLKLPELWQMTPQQLSEAASLDGSEKNTFLNWMEDKESGRKMAVFSHEKVKNVDAALFGGSLPVEYLVISLLNDKVTDVDIACSMPANGGAIDKSLFNAQREFCEKELAGLLQVAAVPQVRYHGSTWVRTLKTLTFTGKDGTACLDHSVDINVLRFSLAPPGTIPLAMLAKGVVELDLNASEFFCDLGTVLKVPELWNLTPRDLDAAFGMQSGFGSPCFQWLSAQKDSARFSRMPYSNLTVDLTLFGGAVHADEVIVKFEKNKLIQVDISLYNRGDSGPVSMKDFAARYQGAGQALSGLLGVRPVERKMVDRTAVKISGWIWTSPHTLALLECNADGLTRPDSAEFIRLKLAPPQRRNSLITPLGYLPPTISRSELFKFVKREKNGDVFIDGIPMVDQGAKGYCVVASCQRLFSFLKIPCDQHELAQISGSDSRMGTRADAFVESLSQIDSRFKVRFKPLLEKRPLGPSDQRQARPEPFAKMIEEYINKGTPLLWALELGLFPEVPDTAMQSGGGHMRLIIGYNSTTGEILFSDSWGAGHELKRMKIADALAATSGIYLIEPRNR